MRPLSDNVLFLCGEECKIDSLKITKVTSFARRDDSARELISLLVKRKIPLSYETVAASELLSGRRATAVAL